MAGKEKLGQLSFVVYVSKFTFSQHMLPKHVRKRFRSKSVSLSVEIWEKIEMGADKTMSCSAFIRRAVWEKLRRDGIA